VVRSSVRAAVRALWLAAATACLATLLAAAGPGHRASAQTAAVRPVPLTSLHWIFYREDLDRIDAADPALVRTLAAGPGTYELEHRPGGRTLPAGISPVDLFSSIAAFRAAVHAASVIPGVGSVAYDLEFFHLTPVAERQDPLTNLDAFALAARASGYQPILIPGRDLVRQPGTACGQQPGLTISQAYLNCGLPGTAADAGIYVIQSAPVETNLPALRQLVQQSAVQARRANPNIIVIATLATAPNGIPATSTALATAARVLLPYVDGFELNSRPATDRRVVSFLEDLSRG